MSLALHHTLDALASKEAVPVFGVILFLFFGLVGLFGGL